MSEKERQTISFSLSSPFSLFYEFVSLRFFLGALEGCKLYENLIHRFSSLAWVEASLVFSVRYLLRFPSKYNGSVQFILRLSGTFLPQNSGIFPAVQDRCKRFFEL